MTDLDETLDRGPDAMVRVALGPSGQVTVTDVRPFVLTTPPRASG